MDESHGVSPDPDHREIQVEGDYFEQISGHAKVNIVRNYITQISEKAFRSSANERKNELVLLDRVSEAWIDGLLQRSLGRPTLELGKTLDFSVVKTLPHAQGLAAVHTETLQTVTQTISQLFAESKQALLILGAPGAGKTTELLRLIQYQADLARRDPAASIPVFFNLSSWGDRVRSIEAWLIEELVKSYLIPRRLAARWVGDAEAHRLQVMLDGLDEVRPNLQQACVTAINEFRGRFGLTSIAVTCRDQDYARIGERLKLNLAVRLQPLYPEQVDRYLAAQGEQQQALRSAIANDHSLSEMASSPLMLEIMSATYNDQAPQSNELISSVGTTAELRREDLLASYVTSVLRRRRIGKRYSDKKTMGWLRHLANDLYDTGQTTFYLEHQQPTRLTGWFWRWGYLLGSRLLSYGLVGAICVLTLVLVLGLDATALARFIVPVPSCILLAVAGSLYAELKLRRYRGAAQSPGRLWRLLGYVPLAIGWMAVICVWLVCMSIPLVIPMQTSTTYLSNLFLVLGIPITHGLGTVGRCRSLAQEIQPAEALRWSARRFVIIAVLLGMVPAVIHLAVAHLRYRDSLDDRVLVWDTKSVKPLWRATDCPLPIEYVEPSPDGKFIVTVMVDGEAMLRSLDGVHFARLEERTALTQNGVRFSPDGSRIVTINGKQEGGRAKLWNSKGQLIRDLGDGFDAKVFRLTARRLILRRADRETIDVFDKDGGHLATLPVRPRKLGLLEQLQAIKTGEGQTTRLWDENGQEITRFGSNLREVQMLSGGERVLSETQDGVVALWLPDGTKISTLGNVEVSNGVSNPVHVSSCGKRIFVRTSTKEEKFTTIFDPDGNTVGRLDGFISQADTISAGDRVIFIRDQVAHVWSQDTGESFELDRYVRNLRLSPDRKVIIAETYPDARSTSYHYRNEINRQAKVWSSDDLALLFTIDEPYVDLAFSPDGGYLLTESQINLDGDSQVNFWNLETGLPEKRFGMVVGEFQHGYQYSSDGRLLIQYRDVKDSRFMALFWLLPGLLAGTLLSLHRGISSTKARPNQGIRLSARSALLVGAAFTIGSGVLLAVAIFLRTGAEFEFEYKRYPWFSVAACGLILGVIGALRYGGLDVIRHFVLRLLLLLNRIAPLRYARFLDYAADRVLLSKVGGGYLFIHRLLLEHFCTSPVRRPPGKQP